MAIVVSKLVSAAMLQDFIIGKDALPLAAGIITMYRDSDQTTLKNWYYQTGVSGAYQYNALPNPMVLSAAGTMQDVNGNDIIPFYYPWSESDSTVAEPYFVTVYNSQGQLQFTRSNFPFEPAGVTPVVASIPTFENYVINGRFWRNIGSTNESGTGTLPNSWTTQYSNSGTVYYQTLAPDNHDGFSMPDFNYVKNVNGSANETITFNTFTASQTLQIVNDIQPEFYINHDCISDSSGASLKAYQFPISLHLATLADQPFTFTMQIQALSLTPNSVIEIYLYAFCGTGASSPVPYLMGSIPLTTAGSGTAWTKATVTNTFPTNLGLILSATGDDAFYLQINMPNGATAACNINFCLPSLYLSAATDVPTNSFSTYDQIDTIVSDPRTGDVRTSVNSFYPFGWVPMNNGLIALTNPSNNQQYARANVDTWPLFNLLWSIGKTYDSGSTSNPLFQMYTNTAGTLALADYGISAYSDFALASPAKALQLPVSMGQVFLGTVPIGALIPATPSFVGYKSTVTASSSSGLLWTTSASNLLRLFKGNTVTFSSTTTLVNVVTNAVYYIVPQSSTTFKLTTTFADAISASPTFVAYTGAETGTVTAYLQQMGSDEGEYAHTQLVSELAQHTHNPLLGSSFWMNGTTQNSAGSNSFAIQNASTTGGVTNYVGSPFNVTQPGTFFNIYIKL